MTGAGPTTVAFAIVSARPLDPQQHLDAVRRAAAGAEVCFTGVVRDHDHGRIVKALEYVAHPGAEDTLRAVAEEFSARPHVQAVAVSHRVGALAVGDLALVAAISTAHRGDAFGICAEFVDEIKRRLPIWKRQVFADGTDEWVNCP